MAVAITAAFSRSPSCFCSGDAYVLLGRLHICPTTLVRTHLMNAVCVLRKVHEAAGGVLALGWHCCLSVSWQVKKPSLTLCPCSVSLVTEAQFEHLGEGSIL